MDFLKVLFENGAITWEQFVQGMSAKGLKVGDLSSGEYVDKRKYNEDIAAKDNIISTLNVNVSERLKDVENLKSQLEEAGGDKDKINALTQSLNELQNKYDSDINSYKAQIAKQEYLSKAKEVADNLSFSSKAAQEMFINRLVEKELKIEDGKLLGADDFVKSYKEANADSFKVEQTATPQFTASTITPPQSPSTYEERLAEARKNNDTAKAISIKREAADNGVMLM